MKMFITALSVFASFAAFADAVTAGWYERAFVDVPDGVQTVQDGKLSVVPGGSLYKTGAGTLVVPQSILDRTYPEFNLKVATGRVRFVDDARPADSRDRGCGSSVERDERSTDRHAVASQFL